MPPSFDLVWKKVKVRRSSSSDMIVMEGNVAKGVLPAETEPIYLSPALAAALAVQLTSLVKKDNELRGSIPK